MVTHFFRQRLSLIALAILLFCGCRSANRFSSFGVNRTPYGSGPTLVRPYGRAPQSYDDNTPSGDGLTPQSEPSDILPAPAYSDPESPTSAPTPSAKKSKWNLIPSGNKISSSMRRNTDIDQTAVKSDRIASSNRASKGSETSPARSASSGVMVETVGSRYSARSTGMRRSSSTPTNTIVSETPILPAPSSEETFNEDASSSFSLKKSTISADSANSPQSDWNRGSRARSGPALDPVAKPLPTPNQFNSPAMTSDAEMPLLLPPGL